MLIDLNDVIYPIMRFHFGHPIRSRFIYFISIGLGGWTLLFPIPARLEVNCLPLGAECIGLHQPFLLTPAQRRQKETVDKRLPVVNAHVKPVPKTPDRARVTTSSRRVAKEKAKGVEAVYQLNQKKPDFQGRPGEFKVERLPEKVK